MNNPRLFFGAGSNPSCELLNAIGRIVREGSSNVSSPLAYSYDAPGMTVNAFIDQPRGNSWQSVAEAASRLIARGVLIDTNDGIRLKVPCSVGFALATSDTSSVYEEIVVGLALIQRLNGEMHAELRKAVKSALRLAFFRHICGAAIAPEQDKRKEILATMKAREAEGRL